MKPKLFTFLLNYTSSTHAPVFMDHNYTIRFDVISHCIFSVRSKCWICQATEWLVHTESCKDVGNLFVIVSPKLTKWYWRMVFPSIIFLLKNLGTSSLCPSDSSSSLSKNSDQRGNVESSALQITLSPPALLWWLSLPCWECGLESISTLWELFSQSHILK